MLDRLKELLFGTAVPSSRHGAAYNAAVAEFDASDHDAAARAFEALGNDRSSHTGLRYAAVYAAALAHRRAGQEAHVADAFSDRIEQLAVSYCLVTAAGLLAREGLKPTAPSADGVIVPTQQAGQTFYYRIRFQDALGTLIAEVTRIHAKGWCVHLEMEDDPTPQALDTKILQVVREAGTGDHDPVSVPEGWTTNIRLPKEKPAFSPVCTIGLTIRGSSDIDRNVNITQAVYSAIASEFPHVSRQPPLTIMSRIDPKFGIRFYPREDRFDQVQAIEKALVRNFKSRGLAVTHHAIVDGTVAE